MLDFWRSSALAVAVGSVMAPAVLAADDAETLSRNRDAAIAAIAAIYGGDVETLDGLIGETYIQHNPFAEDGREPVLAFVAKGRDEGWLGEETLEGFDPLRPVAEGDLAALHYLDQGENKVYVDIFRFDEAGKIVEHWDVAQDFQEPNQSGRTMIDGGGDPDADVSKEQLEAHKDAVRRLLSEYFIEGDVSVVRELVGPDYLQHHPGGIDGVEPFERLVENVGGAIPNTIHNLIAQGDLVYAHVHYPSFNAAAVDIFRFEDGMIVEHWDVIQEIPETMPHDNGMF